MYSNKKQNTVKLKAYLLILSYLNKIKVSNTQFKTDKTRSEERPAKRRYVLQLNCMLEGRCAPLQRGGGTPPVVRRTAPSNMRIKLTAKLKSLRLSRFLQLIRRPVRLMVHCTACC